MRRFLRTHLSTMAVAFTTAAVVAAAPAVAATVVNADKVDGFHAVGCHKGITGRAGKLVATCGATGLLPNNIIAKAPNSDLLDGKDSTAFYIAGSKVADSDLLDGKDSTAFYLTGSKVSDSDLLDGKDSTAFLLATGKAADADKLDGLDSLAFLQGATTQTRYSTCSGSQFYPTDSGDNYQTSGSERYTGGSGTEFRCSVDLPTGATVTTVYFSVEDSDAAGNLDCRLTRTKLSPTSIGTENDMATASTTTGNTSGAQRISDTSISNSAVDSSAYSYYLACVITGTTSSTGIYGAQVQYSISNTAG